MNLNGREILALKGQSGGVTSVAFSADGLRLASVGFYQRVYWDYRDQAVKVWDATSGQELLTLRGHTGIFTSVAFSRDGKRLASAGGFFDATVKVWDATSGQELLTLKGHTGEVTSVAFSADGKRLASAGGYGDQTVKVWDTTSGQEMLTLKGHTGGVTSVMFSPDGIQLASASDDGTVKVWDARPWTPELRAEREALSLIHFLREQGKPQTEWLDAIAADQTISEPIRQRALQFAREEIRERLAAAEREKSQAEIDLASSHLTIGDEKRMRFQFTAAKGHYQQGLAAFEAITERTKLNPFVQQTVLLKSIITTCELFERAIFDLDFALAQDKVAMPELLLTRVQALLAYAGSAPDEVPAMVREKWSTGHLPTELLREAIQTAEKLRALEPASVENLYIASRYFSLCLKRLANLDVPDKDRLKAELQTKALDALKAAIVAAGWTDTDHLARDTDLEPLRELPEFKTMLEQVPRGPGLASPQNLMKLLALERQELVYLRANHAVERTKFIDGTRSILPVGALAPRWLMASPKPNLFLVLSQDRLFELAVNSPWTRRIVRWNCEPSNSPFTTWHSTPRVIGSLGANCQTARKSSSANSMERMRRTWDLATTRYGPLTARCWSTLVPMLKTRGSSRSVKE